MIHLYRGWLVFAILVAVVPSCKRASRTDDADKPAVPVAEATWREDLGLLPVDSELVIGMSFTAIRQSALWKQLAEPLINRDDLHAFKDECDFDPFRALSSVSIGLKQIESEHPTAVVVFHGIEKSKLLPCLDKVKDANIKESGDITRDGDVTSINVDDDTITFSFVNPTTAVIVVDVPAPKQALARAATGGSTLKTSAAFIDVFNKLPAANSIWFVIDGKSSVFSELDVTPTSVFGTGKVTDGASFDIHVRLDSAEHATALADQLKVAAADATALVDKLDIAAAGSEITVSVMVSNTKLKALINQLSPSLEGSAAN